MELQGETAMDTLKQRVFATAFSSWDPNGSLKRYYEAFEKVKEAPEEDIAEFEPETEQDITEMLNAARRAGAIG